MQGSAIRVSSVPILFLLLLHSNHRPRIKLLKKHEVIVQRSIVIPASISFVLILILWLRDLPRGLRDQPRGLRDLPRGHSTPSIIIHIRDVSNRDMILCPCVPYQPHGPNITDRTRLITRARDFGTGAVVGGAAHWRVPAFSASPRTPSPAPNSNRSGF